MDRRIIVPPLPISATFSRLIRTRRFSVGFHRALPLLCGPCITLAIILLCLQGTCGVAFAAEQPPDNSGHSVVEGAGPVSQGSPVTVPITLDHDRMTVEVEITTRDGSVRRARAWVDTGGTRVIIAESLARDLGVDLADITEWGEHSIETMTPVPTIRIGGIPLDTEDTNVSVHRGRFARPGVRAECVLPARSLRKLHVVFDYPARRLTVSRPGLLEPRGTAVACRVNPDTGLVMVEATMDGEKVALGLDTGSAGTWVSDKLTSAWLARHPDWPHAVGAAGSTNFFGFDLETTGTLASLPSMSVGSVPVRRSTAILGLDQQLFDWYSKKSAAPVAGFLGADLLARFRLEIDFPAQKSWWEPTPTRAAADLDVVGLTLRPEADGSFTVAGVVSQDGRPTVEGVRAGDKLLRVGSLVTSNALMGSVIDALRGRPGETRVLLLERDGKEITVRAIVSHLP